MIPRNASKVAQAAKGGPRTTRTWVHPRAGEIVRDVVSRTPPPIVLTDTRDRYSLRRRTDK